jgi:phospholipid/cholesterol/gamma-HCH transport system substrate-binding protein
MKETVVGIFLFIAMLALIMLTYYSDDEHKLFGKLPVLEYRAVFSSVAGLREGDPVYLSGIRVGTITKTTFIDIDGKTMVDVIFNVETRDAFSHSRNSRPAQTRSR